MIPTDQNFFELFNQGESFEVDIAALGVRYRELQSETHPDKFAAASEAEKLRALHLNSLVNEAYNTLKTPLKRAAYLLLLRGIDTEHANQTDLGMDLLMEQMQLREKLAQMPDNDSALPELEMMKKDVISRVQADESRFASCLASHSLQEAKQLFFEMQFLHKLLHEIEQGEEKRLGY